MSNETPSLNRYKAKNMHEALACKRASFCCKFPLRKTSSTLRSLQTFASACFGLKNDTYTTCKAHKQRPTPIRPSTLSLYLSKVSPSTCLHTKQTHAHSYLLIYIYIHICVRVYCIYTYIYMYVCVCSFVFGAALVYILQRGLSIWLLCISTCTSHDNDHKLCVKQFNLCSIGG